jgi:LPXTG-motif cell wall-anchored protein
MILEIKRKKKEKRIQIVGALLGICVAATALFYFFHVEKAEAERRMVEIVNYVKVQLNVQYATKWSKENVWSVDPNTGVKTLIKHSENSTTFTAKADGDDKATGSMTEIGKTDKATEATMTETIINRKGFTLPKTGDIGTAMFLIIGIGGMLAAVYIMLRGRKRA